MGGAMKGEHAIQNAALVAVTALDGVMAWRENSAFAWAGRDVKAAVGKMVRVQPGWKILADARPIRAGVPGIGDIMGTGRGRAFALEMKDAEGSQEVSQRRFQRAFELAGGAYGIARSPDEAVAFLRSTVLR